MKWAIIIILFFCAPIGDAATVNFTVTDSTGIEDTDIYGHIFTKLNNYGRVTGGGGRVQIRTGKNYSNLFYCFLRMPNFKDTCDEYYNSATDTLICDSLRLRLGIHDAAGIGSGDTIRYFTAVIASDKDWVEGNSNAAAAANCEMCYDSAQTVGSGSCATKQDWHADGGVGANDTSYTSTDTLEINDGNASAGDTWYYLYVEPDAVETWINSDADNEGVGIYWSSVTDQAFAYFYGTENPAAGAQDSVPLFEFWGHTESKSTPESPNALHDKSADPVTGALHDKKHGASALHEK